MTPHWFLLAMTAELDRVRHGDHPHPFYDEHQALAVLWEEFEELKAEIFTKNRSREHTIGELVQVAAMCLRWAEDLRYHETDLPVKMLHHILTAPERGEG